MSNAAKHRKKAAEFEQLKQVDRAIAMYIKAIDEAEAEGEEVDVALLNKVGDLTMRQGRIADAVTYYERAVEHYASASLFNNAIALCNKILRNAPGRSNVYFTLGRICAKKGLRGDATRNFLEYATRMQQEGRIDEGMRALAEVAHLMPELTEVRQLVEEHAMRVGIELPRRQTPAAAQATTASTARRDSRTSELIFLDIGDSGRPRNTPPLAPRIPTPPSSKATTNGGTSRATPSGGRGMDRRPGQAGPESLDAFLLFDPTRPGAVTPVGARAIAPPVTVPVTVQPVEASAQVASDTAPVEHGIVEAVTESVAEPLAETVLEPVVEMAVEPVVEPVIEPVIEPVVETVMEPVLEPILEPVLEPVVETVQDPVIETVIEPIVDLVADPASEPVAIPALELTVEPTMEVTEDVDLGAAVVPTLDLVMEPVADETVEPIIDLIVASVPESLGEPTVDLLVGPSVDLVSDLHTVPSSELHETPKLASLIVPEVIAAPDVPLIAEPLWNAASPDGEVFEASISASDEIELSAPVEGLEIVGVGLGADAPILDGLLVDDALVVTDETISDEPNGFMEVVASSHADSEEPGLPSVLDPVVSTDVEALPDLLIEDFDHVADDPHVAMVTGGRAGTPAYGTTLPRSLTPIDVTPVPELDEAIAAGALAAERGAREYVMEERRPPFRLDPHDFILPGELPPLMVDDAVVAAGLQSAAWVPEGTAGEPPTYSDVADETNAAGDVVPAAFPDTEDREFEHDDSIFVDVRDVVDEPIDEPVEAPLAESANEPVEFPHTTDTTLAAQASDEPSVSAEVEYATPVADTVDGETAADIPADRAMATTPSLPIAAVAAEANLVATSRCEELGAAVAASPSDWVLRRRHAEALFEVGARERGLAELQAALSGFAQGGHLGVASDIADELVRISPERIAYHQKRVELAVRLNDQLRLRGAYLDLADALLATGDEARAHAVYARVLELDPWDQRARAALGAAAPPPPPQAAAQEEYVDLAEWLRDDEPSSTRMRMRAPQVSGDEQADFESLLRHFKEGVSRSLGEEDYESHYDLGVAYKEMGLLDDAIAEFQKALRSRRHRLPAYEALGQCFVEQSRHSVAATVLTRALHEPGLGDEHRVGVLYLLAYSCEALQRWDEARSYYSRVFATDIHFRDVAARLAALDLIAR